MEVLNKQYQQLVIKRNKNELPEHFLNSSIYKSITSIEDGFFNKLHSYLFNDSFLQKKTEGKNFSGFLIKPVSDRCNLGCSYCYEAPGSYKPSNIKFNSEDLELLTIEVLKNSGSTSYFYWHGGEPMLAGIDFYKKALSFQTKYKEQKNVINAIQTNGVLLSNQWLDFFEENNFRISLSFDGPKEIHDQKRFYKNQKGSYDNVVKAFLLLSERNIPIHIITVAHESLLEKSEAFYDEIKRWNINTFDIHPNFQNPASFLNPQIFSNIILNIFEYWNKENTTRSFSPINDYLSALVTGQPETCYHTGKCSEIMAIDGNGDYLSCTRPFDKVKYNFGNLKNGDDLELVDLNSSFKSFKEKDEYSIKNSLIKGCKWATICNNGCPQHRITNGINDIAGNSVFCTCHSNHKGGYYEIWNHLFDSINKYLS